MGRLVYLDTTMQENPFKVRILDIGDELGNPYYLVEHTDGRREVIFVGSVCAIAPVKQKKSKVLTFTNKIRIVK